MLKYNNAITVAGMTYSCDMVRIKVSMKLSSFQDFYDEMSEQHRGMKESLNNLDAFKYKCFLSCKYGEEQVLKMGFFMNDVKKEYSEDGFIEFNPNKVAENNLFQKDLEIISRYVYDSEIVRYDLAIDIPCRRNDIFIVRDNRVYSCLKKSSEDFTEYLGKKNQVGHVKLYNKTVESLLNVHITRLEVTCSKDSKNIPKVISLKNLPKSDSTIMQVILCNDNPTLALTMVSSYIRGKYLTLLNSNEIHFDTTAIATVEKGILKYEGIARKRI